MKSTSASASSTRRRPSPSLERAPDDLLGREQREVGDLVLDLLDRLARLGLRSPPWRRRCPRSRWAVGLLAHLALELGAGAARALDDLARLATRLGELLLVLVQQRLGLLARALRGLEVLAHDRAALLDQGRERPERVLAQDQERDEEDDERPDHQPREGLDEVRRVVLGGLGRA